VNPLDSPSLDGSENSSFLRQGKNIHFCSFIYVFHYINN